jgi:hypothetical protein
MNDLALARRLGRRMNHLLVDQSIFAWTHRILGILSGTFCGFAWIATHSFRTPHGVAVWLGRGFPSLTAAIFLVGAFPYVISYSANFHWVNQSAIRTGVFTTLLFGVGVVAGIFYLAISRNHVSSLLLIPVSLAQATAYIFLGERVLGADHNIYIEGEL